MPSSSSSYNNQYSLIGPDLESFVEEETNSETQLNEADMKHRERLNKAIEGMAKKNIGPDNILTGTTSSTKTTASDTSLINTEQMASQKKSTTVVQQPRIDAIIEIGGLRSVLLHNVKRPKSLLESAYLGVLTKKEAEKKLTKKATFGLYHPRPHKLVFHLDSKLLMAYRDTMDKYCHYEIERELMNGEQWYRVLGSTRRDNPRFPTMESLVKYYNIYLTFIEQNGQLTCEVLPTLASRPDNTAQESGANKTFELPICWD